jgi:hypothetical protein
MGNQLKDSSKSQREAWADPTKRRNRLIVETGNDP